MCDENVFDDLTDEEIDRLLFADDSERLIVSDYAIVLGTAPEYACIRADIAASFYKNGGTKTLIVSGAAVSDKRVTECAVMRAELEKLGVPSSAIIDEPNAYDTIQNFTCSLTEICKRTYIMHVNNITVITEPFHIKRSLMLARLFLPRFINIHGYTQGTAVQREGWKSDERLNLCVKNEISILKSLFDTGRLNEFFN